jgi:hypothetical protein
MLVHCRTTEVDKHHPESKMLKRSQGNTRFSQSTLSFFQRVIISHFYNTLIGGNDMEQSFIDKLYDATEGNPDLNENWFVH